MAVKVFKFGGASVRDAENIRNMSRILECYSDQKLVVVISAMGKTTNALESVVDIYLTQGAEAFRVALSDIKDKHLETARMLALDIDALSGRFNDFCRKAEENLETAQKISKSAVYDQIVSLGELFSTSLVTAYLQSKAVKACWLDIRDVIRTDAHFQSGKVDFQATQKGVDALVVPATERCDIVITQGFIASCEPGLSVTLGREGSDYTAAILAFCLDVKDLAIWKDVPGVLTADPRRFENVEKLDRMSYKEAIEMTYYGAQVIHPKTIRPLQNKGIKLHVKSFINPEKEGTVISSDGLLNYPPIVVIQEDVVLMQISSKDFSFIAENHLSRIFDFLTKHDIKLWTMRNSAISFTICIKNPGGEELDRLLDDLESDFSVDVFKNLQLYTIRYFNNLLIEKLTANKVVLFEEKMKYTIQMAVRPALQLKEKEGNPN